MSISKYLLVIALLLVGFGVPAQTDAAFGIPSGGIELEGYAWSSNIGWISMNCTNNSTCATSPYAVTLEESGDVTGFAWSPSVGWIKFGGLAGFPTGPGTVSSNAGGSGTFPDIVFDGWARACSPTVGTDCTSMATEPNAGGWDGWISLSGDGYQVESDVTGFTPTSFAYGHDVNGWISFAAVLYDLPDAPAVTLTGSADPVSAGQPTDLTYEVSGPFTSCIASWDPGFVAAAPGPQTVSVTPTAPTNTYTLECTNMGGTGSDSAVVTTRPDIVIQSPGVNPGIPNITGVYPNVAVQFTLIGVPAGATNVPYEVTFDGATQSGTIDGTGSAIVVSETYNNINYASGLPFVIEVDDSPNVGVVAEDVVSTAANEDLNRYDGTTDLVAPNAQITITGPDIVRTGDAAELNVRVESPYSAQCELRGPSATYSINSGATPVNSTTFQTVINTGTQAVADVDVTTSPLTNATNFAVRCTGAGTDYTEAFSIEVTPNFQEV